MPSKIHAQVHQLRHQQPPLIWQDGFPLGNGYLGAMLWGDGNPLALTLDCSELWDERVVRGVLENPDYRYANLIRLVQEGRYPEALEIFGKWGSQENALTPTKISIGRAEISLGAAVEYHCGLDLDRALVEGVLRTVAATHDLQAFVHKERHLLCLRIGNCPSEAECRLVPLAEMNNALAKLNHPAPQRLEDGPVRILLQGIPEGPWYAVAWTPHGPDFFLTVETGSAAEQVVARAKMTIHRALKDGFERLGRQHVRSWKKFWAESAVCLPEARMEFFWMYGIYLLASSARRGSMPPGLQGVWAMDGVLPPWRGDYHLDMNVQETFWPACASGHLDLLDSWCDYMKACHEPARAYTQHVFGTEGTFWPGATIGRFKVPPGGGQWYTMIFGWSHSGWLAWLVWLRWRYSLDTSWLGQTGYPVAAEIFRFFRANLKAEADGYLHVPLSCSPEYHGHIPEESIGKDPNIDLALIRRCCDWIMEMETALQLNDLTADARRIREKLAPYALTPKKELCLWPGKAQDESHRHPSHLMAIHPAMDLTIESGPEAQAIIQASVDQFLALGQYLWAGHTYAQVISMAAVLGRAGWAYDSLRQFVEHWVVPNGLHINRDWRGAGVSWFRCSKKTEGPFTLEANCGVSAGISDMLVQGWGDVVRIFPAVPDHWRDLAFRDLRAEGAFKVSAIRLNSRTVWVNVTATQPRTLRLRDPFNGAQVAVTGGPLSHEGDLLIVDLDQGQSVTLAQEGFELNWKQVVDQVRRSNTSLLGLA